MFVEGTLFGGAALGAGALWFNLHRRGMNRWLPAYLRDVRRRDPRPDEEIHLLLCIADHFEPQQHKPPPHVASARVARWVGDYPRQFSSFHDSDGQTPRHTFFYPEEEYEPDYLDALAELCQAGYGEVEVHLHHDNDTGENLRRTLLRFKETLSSRHGLFPRRRDTGEVMYCFVHGNWALDNSRPDGRHCGVNNEIDVLRETGCYADFTLPSAPSAAQTSTINRIYYAVDDPRRPKSHDQGIEIGSRTASPANSLRCSFRGHCCSDWGRRKYGVLPRVENACLQASQPPTIEPPAASGAARACRFRRAPTGFSSNSTHTAQWRKAMKRC